MEKNEFKELIMELLPEVCKISRTIQKHNAPGIMSIAIDAEGYVRIDSGESDWYLVKTESDENFRLRYGFEEEIPYEEGKRDGTD